MAHYGGVLFQLSQFRFVEPTQPQDELAQIHLWNVIGGNHAELKRNQIIVYHGDCFQDNALSADSCPE